MRTGKLLQPALMLTSVLLAGAPQASAKEQSAVVPHTDQEQEIVERVKKEVMAELQRGDLQKEINKGIRVFLEEQRAAKQAALESAQKKTADLAKTIQPVSAQRDHIYGQADAPVSLIEYADFKCPYCKQFHQTAKQVVDASNGKVNWVYRHLPLGFHNPAAEKLAQAAECVSEIGGNKAFWLFSEKIYAQAGAADHEFALDQLLPIVKDMQLDTVVFKQCVDSARIAVRVQEDVQEAARIGVTGTPGNVLVDKSSGAVKVLAGNAPMDTLKKAIADLQITEINKAAAN